jgi:hypothetical protein
MKYFQSTEGHRKDALLSRPIATDNFNAAIRTNRVRPIRILRGWIRQDDDAIYSTRKKCLTKNAPYMAT